MFNAGQGAGQSGSFFFYSNDGRFILKTMRGSEKKKFLSVLDDFIYHIDQTNNNSLLARIYGIFTISTNYYDPFDIIIMQNTA